MASVDFDSAKSLVKFTNPILVMNKAEKGKEEKKRLPQLIRTPKYAKEITADRCTDTQEILNCILPPREWEENGQIWREQVSSEPATRADVMKLGEQLDKKLQQQQARETGICAVRRELFNQAFDEIIRQVTVNCAERGLLLLRVRDELRMTVSSFQSLYESSIGYGMRKALMAEQGKLEFEDKIVSLKAEKSKLQQDLQQLKQSYEILDRRTAELKATEEKRHQQDLQALQRKNAELKAQLEAIVSPSKS
ncbi:hypothetical protein GE061_011836 [Apolygus lucorum]|uniref:33 kDa inner dynein arm light chain, axonemal n=1 Tax=Apolygus lucorum TaxID=248454 RepID=A0A8S9Y2Q3_APOLU|nr:hypothetical protein GE061_011836 [Apolygus lucorum]